MSIDQDIIRYVQSIEAKSGVFGGESSYDQYVRNMAAVNLKNITPSQVASIIDPFLVKWGWMSRSLHRNDREGWDNVLAIQIQFHESFLSEARNLELADEDLKPNRWIIEACFGSFRSAIGPISAAKTLHLIAPTYFPAWDTEIAELAHRFPRSAAGLVSGPRKSSRAYYGYVQQVQNFLQTYQAAWDKLANEFQRTNLKMIDAYLWQNQRRDAWFDMRTAEGRS